MDHDRAIKLRREIGLVGRAQITAPLKLVFDQSFGMRFLQHLHGFIVGNAREWRIDLLQLGDIAADDLRARDVGAPGSASQ